MAIKYEDITSQEELDAAVEAELTAERAKYEGFENYKKKAGDYDALKKASDGYAKTIDDLRKEIDGDDKNDGYKKTVESLQAKVKKHELNDLKMRIAHENGIPYEMAGRLTGEDESAIKKDAESMAKYLKKTHVPPLADNEPEKVDTKRAATKKMLAQLKGE